MALGRETMNVTVYAITNSRTVPDIPGLRALRVGTLAALVTDTRRTPAPSPANLRRYHRTIAAIADALPAALPARFGTLMTEPELVPAVSGSNSRPISAGPAPRTTRK